MKTKLLFLTLLLPAFGGSLFAQKSPSNPVGANITVADAGSCSTVNSFLWQQLPNNAGTTTVNLAGTFVATVTIRESNNGGGSWTTATTLSAAGTTTFSTNGFTDICADVTAYTSGTVQVSLSTGLQQVQSVVSGGSSSGASVPAPIMGFYLGPQCPVANTGQCFFTQADTQEVSDCGWTNAAPDVNCTNAHFSIADVGKNAMGFGTCATDPTNTQATGGSTSPNAAPLTIASFLSSTHITLSGNPANTFAISNTAPLGGCFIWGHFDDAGAALLDTAAQAAPQCPKIFLSATSYFFTQPHFFTNPTACQNIGPALGGPRANPVGFGAVILSAGYELEGRGTGPTTFYLSTNFPNGDACNHLPTPSAVSTIHGGSCFVIPAMGKWSDFRIDGGGQGSMTSMSGKTLLSLAVATLNNFMCGNVGTYQGGNMIGVEMVQQAMLYQVNVSGCGTVPLAVSNTSNTNVGVRVVSESGAVSALVIEGPPAAGAGGAFSFTCYYCILESANSQPFGAFPAVLNIGGVIKLFGGSLGTFNGNSGANTNNGINTYSCQTTAGCVLYADSTAFVGGSGGASNTNGAINCTVACTNYLINSSLSSQSAGFDYQDVAGSSLFDLGGNTYTPRFTVAGANHHTESGTCTFAAATTCAVTFNRTYGAAAPSFFVPPNIVGTTTTLTVSALSATAATITASASNSGSVNWTAVQ